MIATKPLSGKRILVTRAVEQSRELKHRLEALGAEVLLLPAISFSVPRDTSSLDDAIASLETFDWLLFTSVNAVKFFADRCRAINHAIGENEKPRCAAVGPVTAGCAAAEGFSIDYVAQEFLGTSLAKELGPALSGMRVLLPRSDRARRDLPDTLRSIGAVVIEVVAYHTGGVGAIEPGVMEALNHGRVDAISFFSPSAVENLRGELGTAALSRLDSHAAMAAVGPVTAAALRDIGLRVSIQAGATAESMANALVKYFSEQQHGEIRARVPAEDGRP